MKAGMRVEIVKRDILSIPLFDENIKTFDYTDVSGFARKYLETYCTGDIDPDESAITEFLVREYRKIEGQPAMVEIGCGPTIHRSLPAAPYVSRVDMTDFLAENIEEVRLWKEGDPTAHNWDHFVKMVLEMEGKDASPQAIAAREHLLRSRIQRLGRCDVLSEHPLGENMRYPVVGFFYVAEEAAIDKEEWKAVMKRVLDIVEPGGRFFCAALWATHFYVVVRPNGLHESLPTAYLLESDLADVLAANGFDMAETVINVVETPAIKEKGVPGVILVSAKKK